MFHPIHFTALITVLIVAGSLWLSYTLSNPWVFVFACLVLPNVMSIGRFGEDPRDELPPDHDYGDDPQAGFLAQVKGTKP